MLNLFVESSRHRLSTESSWQLCPWAARGRKHRCGSCCPVCTHSDDVISSQKRLFVSFHNAQWVRVSVNTIKQHQCDYLTAFGDTFGFWLSCSTRLLYTFTPQLDETPPGNLMIICVDSFWKGNNQWGQSIDCLTNPEIWSPHSLTHSLSDTHICRAVRFCGPAKKNTSVCSWHFTQDCLLSMSIAVKLVLGSRLDIHQ